METVQILMIIMILLIALVMVLSIAYIVLLLKNNKKERKKTEKNKTELTKQTVNNKKSVYDFMEFDEVKDNMIIRKNRNQYIMVINCRISNTIICANNKLRFKKYN